MNTTPAHLIVATNNALSLENALYEAQKSYCSQQKLKECLCNECRKIKTVQHQGLLLINPTDAYTLEDLEAVFEITKFGRAENEPFYIIFSHAELFSAAVGNRLLKLLEEPPVHYHFILTTNNEDRVLPTIRSRSAIIRLENNDETLAEHPLVVFFMLEQAGSLSSFEEALKEVPHHTTSYALLTQLLALNNNRHLTSIKTGDEKTSSLCSRRITYLKKALHRPPQQGSSELFWKQFYLGFPAGR